MRANALIDKSAWHIYRRLPTGLRSAAASLHGYRLRSWRYGAETERLVEEAIARESWDASQWRKWREERLRRVLHRAATRVPYYRAHWSERRRKGDRASWEELSNWPILDKEPVRQNSRAFVADDCDTRVMQLETTSGTTFKPLEIWWSRETTRQWYALLEARCVRWYGLSREARWAHLGAKWVAPVGQAKPPFWVWNKAMRQLYMSSYHLTQEHLPRYLDALRDHGVQYIWGYPSSLYPLARSALELGRNDLGMAVAVTDAEQLFEYQRDAIARAFQCPVCETYGMAELAAAGSQCPAGQLHMWPEVGWVEVMADHPSATACGTGELVCTGLLNLDMPLIRYRVGDRGRIEDGQEACECGRNLPVAISLEGRMDQVLYAASGRPVGRLCTVIKGGMPIHEAQLVQESMQRIRVRYVPTPEFTARRGKEIVERLQACMGDIEVVLEQVPSIPRGPNGKFRAVVCQLPVDELRSLKAGASFASDRHP